MKTSKPTGVTRNACAFRDKWRCVRCGKELYGIQASLHHRRLRSHPFPGLHKTGNLIWLCGSGTTGCHGWVHAHPEESYENGWMVHGWDNPTLVPVTVGGNGRYLLDDYGKARKVTGVVADSLL